MVFSAYASYWFEFLYLHITHPDPLNKLEAHGRGYIEDEFLKDTNYVQNKWIWTEIDHWFLNLADSQNYQERSKHIKISQKSWTVEFLRK